MQGKTINSICKYLTEQGYPTPGGKKIWGVPTVNSILQNEKYAGNALLQKSFTVNYLTKETKRNEGEIPQYFVEGSHPSIITPVVFNLVQEEIQKNREQGKKRRSGLIFSSMVYCGGVFGSKIWGSNTNFLRQICQCNEKYRVKGAINCNTPFVTDEELKRAFILAFNRILDDKDDYIPIVETLTETKKLDNEITMQQERCCEIYSEIEIPIRQNANHVQSQAEYKEQYSKLVSQYEDSKLRRVSLESDRQNRMLRRQKILHFLESLRQMNGLLQEFDEGIFRGMIERMTVYSKKDISVTFKDGNEIHIDLGE